jgi:hypothetical protein
MTIHFSLQRNNFGQLVLSRPDGPTDEQVVPVRAFPIQAPDDGIALVTMDGREAAWIDQLSDLSISQRDLVEEELAAREFMPEISQIVRVSSYAVPCTWTVSTDRGPTQFVLRGEEDIRRVGDNTLLVTDSHGIHFLIRDVAQLDKHSRKILDRFL